MIDNKDLIVIGWNYFQQHAQQRIGYFNFFLLFSSFITAAFATVIKEDKLLLSIFGIALGVVQLIIAYLFWEIDKRNKELTKNGEDFVMTLEKKYRDVNSELPMLFTAEVIRTNQRKLDEKNRFILCRTISHSKAFKYIFITFSILGVFEIVLASFRLNELLYLASLVVHNSP